MKKCILTKIFISKKSYLRAIFIFKKSYLQADYNKRPPDCGITVDEVAMCDNEIAKLLSQFGACVIFGAWVGALHARSIFCLRR